MYQKFNGSSHYLSSIYFQFEQGSHFGVFPYLNVTKCCPKSTIECLRLAHHSNMSHWQDDWQGQLLIGPTEHAAQVGEGEHGDGGEQVDLQQGGEGEGDIVALAHHVKCVEQYQEVVESLLNLLIFQNNKGEYVPSHPHAGHHHHQDPLHEEGHSDQPGRGAHRYP